MKRVLFLLLVVGLISGCYPKGPKYISELDLAATNYSDDFDFEAAKLYFIFDTIFHPEDNSEVSRAYDNDILSRVRSNMSNQGYTEVNTPQESDMVIAISAWQSTSVNYYGGYYPPYWGGGWGWYYPPGWGFVTTSTFGSILIDMSDPNTDQEETIEIVWSGLVNGMVSNSSSSSIRQRIDTSIDQCFAHPPFNN